MKIVGYTDPLTVEPGQSVSVMVSSVADRFRARLVELTGSEVNQETGELSALSRPIPGDLGVWEEHQGRAQELHPGSYAFIPDVTTTSLGTIMMTAWIYPTLIAAGPQTVMSVGEQGREGFDLGLSADGLPGIRIWKSGAVVEDFSLDMKVSERSWYFIAAGIDAGTRQVTLASWPREEWPGDQGGTVLCSANPVAIAERSSLTIAACSLAGDRPERCFNGRVADPTIIGRRLNASELREVWASRVPPRGSEVMGTWDFYPELGQTSLVRDTSGRGGHGRAVNMPARGIPNHRWLGQEVDFRLATTEYTAAHFHEDDLDDAAWDVDYAIDLDDAIPSGLYAVELAAGDAVDIIPFFVRPKESHQRIALLIPTFTYLAYGNEQQLGDPNGTTRREFEASGGDFSSYPSQAEDKYAIDNRILSNYDTHSDGSGVFYSSRLRPLVNLRPHYRFPYLRQGLGGPHGLPADLQLISWLRHEGYDFDVITDEDLHREGVDLLRHHDVVVSGTHAEYWSAEMLDGVHAFLTSGGRFMYLSGNGFYWVTQLDPEGSHTIEVRRWGHSSGTWETDPGEWYHSFTGELGGIWRFRGRASQRFAGVGYSAIGLSEGRPFRKVAEVPHGLEWVFDGVQDDQFGDYRSSVTGRGAAGWELDRHDPGLGSPVSAFLLATASEFPRDYHRVVEDTVHHPVPEMNDPLVRADLVLQTYPNGGAIFSASTIGWCAVLQHNEHDNDVARVTRNVIERFLSDAQLVAD